VLEIVGHDIILGGDGANFTCGVLGWDININNNMAVVGKIVLAFHVTAIPNVWWLDCTGDG
jgi:hypothetical protein